MVAGAGSRAGDTAMKVPRYHIVQTPDGVWVITSTRDPGLIWCGSHWGYFDQRSGVLISFADRESAERYAAKILGGT